jgi:hypothetical protein
MVQAMGLGVIKDLSEALPIIKATFPITEWQPQDTEAWDKAYERFGKIG